MASTQASLRSLTAPLSRARDRIGKLPWWLQVAILVALSMLIPLWGDDYITAIGVSVLTFAMLGMGLNIVVGYAGLLDLGYAAFFAIGAYTTAYLMTTHNLSFWLMLPLGAFLAALFGVIIGAPTLRLRSDYLAIVTLGFGAITRIAVTNLD